MGSHNHDAWDLIITITYYAITITIALHIAGKYSSTPKGNSYIIVIMNKNHVDDQYMCP